MIISGVVLLTLICPMLGFLISVLGASLDKARASFYLFIICSVVAVPALFFLPAINYDATRIFSEMSTYLSYQDFSSIIKHYFITGSDYRTYPVFIWLMFLVSKTGLFTLLSFISVLFTYFLFCLPLFREWKKENISYPFFILGFIGTFFWISYVSTISGMRFYLGLSVFFISIYIDLINDSKPRSHRKNILILMLYFIALLIHPGTIFFLLVRLIVFLANKIPNYMTVSLIIIFVFILQFISRGSISGSSNYLIVLFNRLITYNQNSNFSDLRTLALTVKNISGILVNVYMLLVSGYALYKKRHNDGTKKLDLFVFSLSAMTLSFSTSYNLISRFSLISVPLLIIYYNNRSNKIASNSNLLVQYIGVILICFSLLTGINYNRNIIYLDFNITEQNVFLKPIFLNFKYIMQYK